MDLLDYVDQSLRKWFSEVIDETTGNLIEEETNGKTYFICPICKNENTRVSMPGYMHFHFKQDKPCRDWLIRVAEIRNWDWYWEVGSVPKPSSSPLILYLTPWMGSLNVRQQSTRQRKTKRPQTREINL